MTVLNHADGARIGAKQATGVYVGAEQIWPPFAPSSIPGLTIWLDADHLALADGAAVSPWPNLANPALPGAILGSPAPKIRANALDRLPVVRFSADEGAVVMDGTNVGTNFTIVFLARMVGPTAARIVAGDINYTNLALGWVAGNQDTAYAYGANYFGNPVPWTDDWKLYSVDEGDPGDEPRFFSDGVLLGQAVSVATVGFDSTLVISGLGMDDGTQTSDCEVAELVLYDHLLTDPQRQRVESYFRAKWLGPAAPLAPPEQITDLLWWIDPSTLQLPDGATVTDIPDLSGNGHTTSTRFGAPFPVFAAGKPSAIKFPDTSPTDALKVARLGTALTGLDAFTVLVAVKPTAFDNYPIILAAPTDNAWSWILEFDTGGGVYCGVTSGHAPMFTPGPDPNAWSILTWVHDGPDDHLWIGATASTVAAGVGGVATIPDLGPDAILGGYYNNNYGLIGDLGEVLIYGQALADADRLTLTDYLTAKWASGAPTQFPVRPSSPPSDPPSHLQSAPP